MFKLLLEMPYAGSHYNMTPIFDVHECSIKYLDLPCCTRVERY